MTSGETALLAVTGAQVVVTIGLLVYTRRLALVAKEQSSAARDQAEATREQTRVDEVAMLVEAYSVASKPLGEGMKWAHESDLAKEAWAKLDALLEERSSGDGT